MDALNDFQAWYQRMGFTWRQVGRAGLLAGINSVTAGRLHRSERKLTDAERLALSAATFGLPAWTPETHGQIVAMKARYDQVMEMARNMQA